MKDWNMIHKIKSLFDNGNGLSRRKIAEQLKISRGTVNKYLSMTEDEIATHLTDRSRDKQLDPYKDYILDLLQTWPDLSAQKIYQKLTIRQPELVTSTRSVRRYVEPIKIS
jgi:transposase